MTPFKMIGNLYFVGTKPASSHLIDTGDGLILIDVGYKETADHVIESMKTLGFDVRDVKKIILSHGHGDHSDGVPKIKALSGATVYMCELDNKYLDGFKPDVNLQDGDVVSLGNTSILCLHTPGHTEGTFSFFFDVSEDGVTYRAGMFGGAGIPQLRKEYLDRQKCSYRNRGLFFKTLERLENEHVDVFVGNHVGQNKTAQKFEMIGKTDKNPFIDPTEWKPFIQSRAKKLLELIDKERTTEFVNYAHRGAPAYLPENTFMSFYGGLAMGANGIETDVRRAKDGTLVLFHDSALLRVTGESGNMSDYTYHELQKFDVKKDGLTDKIPSMRDFLEKFSHRDITFAIELKDENIEKDTAHMLRAFNMQKKTVVTSFEREYIKKFKKYAPDFRVGLLTKEINDEVIEFLTSIGADEICPRANILTPEITHELQKMGLRVRAWGVGDEELMRHVIACGADGMTVNFPDKLTKYIEENFDKGEE